MKTKRLYSLLIAILLTAIGIQAQEMNKLYIPDVRAGVGEKIELPVCVQNTSKIITGIQFTIKVGEGVAVDINNATLTSRLEYHKMKVASKGDNTYTVMVYSSDNAVLTGSDGAVVKLPIAIDDTVKVGVAKPITLTKAVLSDNLGNNVLTESNSGTINVVKFPQLSLSAASTEVKEGEKILFTITNEDAPSAPLQISISSDMPGRLKYPAYITMDANSSSVTFEVEALDNGEVSDTLTASIKVSATEHKDGECLLMIVDDDMPEIELELKPDIVSEGDGPSAVIGKITRKTKTENRVTIVLSDDSNGNLYYSNKRITMPAGATEIEFTMGAIDNAAVEDERHYNVTAAVYIPSCSCSAKETSAGYVTKPITVTDDDGPTLKVTSAASSVKEGSSIFFTISHNVDSEKDVTIELTSDNDDAFEYEHKVTIPAGKKSVQVVVKAKENETIEGNRTVVFTVKTDGFATGTCYIQLTDQTIPDVSIANFTVTPAEIEVGQKASLSITITNKGNAALPSLTRVNFYISNSSKELGHVYTADTLAVGGELTLTHEIEMPNVTGQYSLRAVVNEDRAVKELTYFNNSSENIPITLLPAFTATAQSDKALYATGETVTISGKAKGTKAANSEVEVYLINEGCRQTITANTDAEGIYSVEYVLPKSMSGHFVIGACYPKENLKTEMASFDVYGIRLSDCSNNCEFDLGDTYNGTMTITNAVNIKQTRLKVMQNDSPENCEFVFTLPETIEANESLTLKFSITPNAVSTGRGWRKLPITITSDEGASTNYSINYYINSRKALLTSDIKSVNTTMTKGAKREYPITIKNVGKGETGKVTIAQPLPSWMRTTTPLEMASLQQGDSATIILQFSPTENLQLNVPVSGNLGINCENGDGISIPFTITPVSVSEGKLIIDVVDEFSFETQEAPHVCNAKVRIKRPNTGELVAQGLSSAEGLFSVTVPEGQYEVSVTANNHEEYTNQIIVDAGKDNNHEVFISYDAVTYSWDVVETEVEDSYEIETIVKYDTRVPKPVILITLPSERPEDGSIIPIVVTNKGFINAEDVNVSLAISGNWNIDFLTEPYLAKLAANQTEIFYARISSKDVESVSKRASLLNECLSLQAKLNAHYICGNKYDNTVTADDLRRWGQCLDYAASHGYSYGGYGGGGGYAPGGGGLGNYGSGWLQIVPIPAKACKPGNNNSDAPVVPVNRDKVDDGNPKELPCESKEEPTLVYKLVPVSGERYEMNGVAADGVSQVKIVLDPKQSSIPSQDCDNFYGFSWVLLKNGEVVEDSERFGSIEKISDWEAIYTAPSYFIEEYGSVTTVEAQLWYRHKDPTLPDEYEGWLKESPRVKIEIVRPPVVFIHGLGDNRSCWYNAERFLTETGYYKKRFNYRVDYRETNASTFMSNVGVVSDGIYKARERAAMLGYVATKCDLIGHSMGGILARLFVERSGKTDNVNRIITVNTPHAGSELGDIVTAHNLVLKKVAQLFYGKDDIDAVKDLAVESDEMALLVSVPGHLDIPCYAIGTQSDLRDIILVGGADVITRFSAVAFAASLVGAIADPEPITKALLIVASIGCGEVALEGRHLLDDYIQVGEGDLVVSSESQLGGCEASELIEHGPWHCNSPKDYKVIDRIKELLKIPSSDPTFSTNWFNPKKRSFKHASDWELWGQRIWNVLSNVIPSSHWGDLISVGASEWSFLDNVTFECEVLTNTIHKAPATRGAAVASTQERVLKINIDLPNELTNVMSCIYLNGHLAYILQGEDNEFTIPSTYSGEVSVKILLKDSNDNLYSDERILNIETPLATAVSIEADDVDVIEGKDTYLSLECIWDDETRTIVKADNVEFEDGSIASYSDGVLKGIKVGKTSATITYAGLSCNSDIIVYPSNIVDEEDSNESSNSVCSTITLSFKQEMVMTRQAFRGTLTVNNGDAVNEMKDVKLNLEVKDEAGNVATSHEFQINADSISGFKGELDLTSGWTLDAKGTGIATILFIPTKYAAPTEPKLWSFGGTFSYTDPSTGLAVTKTLNPVTLTVKPSPNLTMDYFMQRDVLGDDALTEDIVEPMVPAEFSLLINNKGYGDATNVKMVTNQPEIIDNEKGLLINFEVLSSQLDGGERTLALGKSVATDFGTIPSGKTSYAQWWFTSSLLGHFTEYDVKATHLTSYGNPDLTLLDTIAVHELIHTLTIPKSESMRGFLVNDVKESKDLPDMLYITDGTVKAVAQASGTLTESEENVYILTATPTAAGWNYGNLVDPTNGHKVLASITRQSDGQTIPLANFWQTDRTLRDNKDPLYEYRLHFADEMAATGETYTLTFEDKPMTILAVDTIVSDKIKEGVIASDVDKVTVTFNKAVAASTFTTEDIELLCQGEKVDVSNIEIVKIDEKNFELNLKPAIMVDGYYVLTVQAATIRDTESYTGEYGKQISWTQMVQQEIKLEYDIPEGWSWISSNISSGAITDAKSFLEPVKNKVDRLVGIEKELTNDPTYGLVGNLTTILPVDGYKLHVNSPVQFDYSGIAGEPTSNVINLHGGWNWIGYVPIKAMSVEEAMKNHTPTENDVLKCQDAFTTYSDGAWTGTLTEMKPGEGYMYFSTQDASFIYPKAYASSVPAAAPLNRAVEVNAPWQYDVHKYADNSALIGKLYVDNEYDAKGNYIVGAFCDDECRGVGVNVNGLVYMVIHGTIGEKSTITFRAYNRETGSERNIQENFVFEGQNLGAVKSPTYLHVGNYTRISTLEAGFTISPRPIKNKLYIAGNTDAIKTVQILSANGKTVLKNEGYDQSGIDVGALLPAMYIIAIETNDGKICYDKVFKINN